MTDELKFYDPETGAELHRVPEGATIPAGTPYGAAYRRGAYSWIGADRGEVTVESEWPAFFTREPIAPPRLPLPTEPGYYTDKDDFLCQLDALGIWRSAVKGISFTSQGIERLAPFTPVTIVPTETWDRLRVLDPEDKRDRADRDGNRLKCSGYSTTAEWERALAYHDSVHGPLRFADELSDDDD